MKNYKKIIGISIFTIFVIGTSCKKDTPTLTKKEEVAPSNGSSIATVDGNTVNFVANSAKSTESNFSITMNSNNGKILKLTTSLNESGTYSVENNSGRLEATAVVVFFTQDGVVFYGTSGVLVLTIANGIATGTFSFSAKSGTGTTTQVNNGSFSGINIAIVTPSGTSSACRLIKFTSGNEITSINYNANGRVSSFSYSPENRTETFEYNTNGKLVKNVFSYTKSYETYEYNASGNVSKRSFYGEDNTLSRYETYTYQNGKVSEANSSDGTKSTFVWDGDNLTSITQVNSPSGINDTYSFSNYDTWLNPLYVLSKNMGLPFVELSKNNYKNTTHSSTGNSTVNESSTNVYTYDSNGKVIKYIQTRSDNSNPSQESNGLSTIYEYSGCD